MTEPTIHKGGTSRWQLADQYSEAAAAIGWEWKEGTIMDGFVRGRQLAILLDGNGTEVGQIAIVERKVRKGLRGNRVFPQLVEVWQGTVERFLARM